MRYYLRARAATLCGEEERVLDDVARVSISDGMEVPDIMKKRRRPERRPTGFCSTALPCTRTAVKDRI